MVDMAFTSFQYFGSPQESASSPICAGPMAVGDGLRPRPTVPVNYGLDLLHDHQHGKDVAEVLALVDETGRREGEELEEVLQKLSAAVKLQHG